MPVLLLPEKLRQMDRRTFIENGIVLASATTLSGITTNSFAQETRPVSEVQNKSFWPNGARLAISISMQFEAGAQPDGAESPFPPLDPKYPDLPAKTWFEYGYKEGVPRLLDLWDRKNVKVTSHMVGKAVEKNPTLAREIVQRGHEAAAHGYFWAPQFSMTPEQELAEYKSNIKAIQDATGTRPVGFNAFWMRGTPKTLGILQELGFIYHIDDMSRDEPFTVQVNGRPFVVVPYTVEHNDIVLFEARHFSGAAFAQELKDAFDVLYEEAGGRRRMMSISAHDRIAGHPARVKAFSDFIDYAQKQKGVWFARKDEIAKWILECNDAIHEG
jgi:peptidoglycan/xylan/chitin deacetylase (PgdA/CDA1 family)